MARLVRGHSTPKPQQEGTEEPESDPHQEEQPDAVEDKVIADYNPDIDYKGLEPKVEPVTQEQWEVDSDAEYAGMEVPQDGTFCQRMMPLERYMGILWVHKA